MTVFKEKEPEMSREMLSTEKTVRVLLNASQHRDPALRKPC